VRATVTLGEVCAIEARQVDPMLSEYAALPHVGPENIESGTGRLLAVRTAAQDGMTSGKYLFEAGDILYSKIRPYLRKAAIAPFKGLCSADVYPLRVKAAVVDSQYLLWLLLSEGFTRYAHGCSGRARMPKLNREQLLSWRTAVPSLAEQRRIAAHLSEQLAAIERARDAGAERVRSAQLLTSSAVTQVFSGEEGREWPHVSLADVGPLVDGDWILNSDYSDGGVRLLQVGDVGIGSFRGTSRRFVSASRVAELKCTLLEPGDVLVSRMPDPIGRACELPELGYPAITAVDVTIWRPSPKAYRPFLVYYLNSAEWFDCVRQKASGATRVRISRRNLEALQVPLPDISVQRRVASLLRDAATRGRLLLDSAKVELGTIEALPAALLRQAFL